MSICAAFMFFAAVLALALRTLLVWENGKLDRKYTGENAKDEAVAVEDYGPGFRYVL